MDTTTDLIAENPKSYVSRDFQEFQDRKILAQNRVEKLIFTNKDCVQCFSLGPRELNFIVTSMTKASTPLNHLFPKAFFDPRGCGKTRILSYWQFYAIGLMKTLNNTGILLPFAASIVTEYIFDPKIVQKGEKELSNHLFSISEFFIYEQNIRSGRQRTYPQFSFDKNFDSLYSIRIDLHNYNRMFFNYIEQYCKENESTKSNETTKSTKSTKSNEVDPVNSAGA